MTSTKHKLTGEIGANNSQKVSKKTEGWVISGEGWIVPEEAGDKIPKDWGSGQANKKKLGWRWQDPTNQGNGVRIDLGNLNNSHPSQQVDRVVVRKNGQVIGRNGQPITGSIKTAPTEAHIPLDEWLRWTTWYEP